MFTQIATTRPFWPHFLSLTSTLTYSLVSTKPLIRSTRNSRLTFGPHLKNYLAKCSPKSSVIHFPLRFALRRFAFVWIRIRRNSLRAPPIRFMLGRHSSKNSLASCLRVCPSRAGTLFLVCLPSCLPIPPPIRYYLLLELLNTSLKRPARVQP